MLHLITQKEELEPTGGLQCHAFQLGLAGFVAVPTEPNMMASAMNIASNAIVRTTGRDNPTRHATSTARSVGNGCVERSSQTIPFVRRAKTVVVSHSPASSITKFRSNTAAHRLIGKICNHSAIHATRRSPCTKAADGRGVGACKSLWVSPSDRRGSIVRISAG